MADGKLSRILLVDSGIGDEALDRGRLVRWSGMKDDPLEVSWDALGSPSPRCSFAGLFAGRDVALEGFFVMAVDGRCEEPLEAVDGFADGSFVTRAFLGDDPASCSPVDLRFVDCVLPIVWVSRAYGCWCLRMLEGSGDMAGVCVLSFDLLVLTAASLSSARSRFLLSSCPSALSIVGLTGPCCLRYWAPFWVLWSGATVGREVGRGAFDMPGFSSCEPAFAFEASASLEDLLDGIFAAGATWLSVERVLAHRKRKTTLRISRLTSPLGYHEAWDPEDRCTR